MTFKRMLTLAFLGSTLITIIGCGGGSQNEEAKARSGSPATTTEGSQSHPASNRPVAAVGSRSYVRVLHGLKRAAPSKDTYQAVRRSRTLRPVEAAVVEEFCNFVWQIRVNKEERVLGKGGYIAKRIVGYAAYERSAAFAVQVEAAVAKLRTVIDLGSLRSQEIKGYIRSCYK